jgi:hypothetical protein
MTEIATDKMLIIVHLSNDERLNASETDDFFLVSHRDYPRAAKVLRDLQAHRRSENVTTIRAVKNRLNEAKIDYEQIEDGLRVYLGNVEEPEEDDNS